MLLISVARVVSAGITLTEPVLPDICPAPVQCKALGGLEQEHPDPAVAARKVDDRFVAFVGYAGFMFVFSLLCLWIRRSRLRERFLPHLLEALDLVGFATMWFSISISLTLFNKWFFTKWDDGSFCFPISVTSLHMTLKGAVAGVWVVVCRDRREGNPTRAGRVQEGLGFKRWLGLACPIGAATAMDVALSNWANLYLSVSFITLVKTSTLVWTFLASLLTGVQRFSWPLCASVFAVVFGIGISTVGERENGADKLCFDPYGFFLALMASVVGGFRWVLTEILMRDLPDFDRKSTTGVMQTLFWISPAAIVVIFSMSFVEESERLHQWDVRTVESGVRWEGRLFALLGGVLALFLIVAELALLVRASALSMGVVGYVKEVLTITFSIIVFGDNFTFLNALGLAIALTGCVSYVRLKSRLSSRPSYSELGLRTQSREGDSDGTDQGGVELRAGHGGVSPQFPYAARSRAGKTTRSGLQWAEAHMMGKRKAMEDASEVREMSNGWVFLGVFDGHGD
eukprot:Hpha_TRINITY_DN18818_c0_g1::TRINITY_DN18818_c0_g1_i1::g.26414::m.26414/K15280/SLC35C2; solute carrier family 35, member C2